MSEIDKLLDECFKARDKDRMELIYDSRELVSDLNNKAQFNDLNCFERRTRKLLLEIIKKWDR